MLNKEIDEIGFTVYSQELKSLEAKGLLASAITGSIDMEYEGKELLSTQISIEGQERIYYMNYTDIPQLKALILKQLDDQGVNYKSPKKPIHLFLATYWSSAEFNNINNLWEDADMRHVTPKIMNANFIGFKRYYKKRDGSQGSKTTLHITLLDIFHFFTDLKMPLDENGHRLGKGLVNVAKLYGLNAQKMSLDGIGGLSGKYWIEHMATLKTKHPLKFRQYALQDVTVTEELMKKHRDIMFNETGIDLFRAHTNGGIAMSYFRTFKMHKGQEFGNSNGAARKLALLCGHGGVMVALKHGLVKTVYENDFKQFYTNISANTKKLPRNAEEIYAAGDLAELLSGYDGWGKVKFHFPDTYKGKKLWPTLPVQELFPNSAKISCVLFPKNGISFCTVTEIRTAMLFGAKIEFMEGYYYIDGSGAWSVFAKEQVEYRETAQKKEKLIEAALHKSMPNAAVGKLLQHKRGKSLASIKAVAEYLEVSVKDVYMGNYGIADLEYTKELEKDNKKAMSLLNKILPDHQEHGVGSSWLPEWWIVILGRARAALWWTVNTYAIDPVHLSTDSFHDVKPLTERLNTPAGIMPIEVKHTHQGEDMFLSRTKLSIHGNKVIHEPETITEDQERGEYSSSVISHALHADRVTGGKLIVADKTAKYIKNGNMTLFQAMAQGCQFADAYKQEMTFNPGFDYKVKILENGEYEPWENIAEYFAFKKELGMAQVPY
jgi:hypothetical protein